MPSFASSPADRRAMAAARGAIADHRATFELFAGGATRAGHPLEAAALARMAYTFGMFKHPGLLVSPELEALLNRVGREQVPGAAEPAGSGASGPERVLHVATVVYETGGGHGRILERWIERDSGRIPTVLLLNTEDAVPASLTAAVEVAGGGFAQLAPGDLFARARELRSVAAEHDLVVLHASNHEVVLPLAFADPAGRPPTIVSNHSSHLLWAGVASADVVANFNAFDVETTVQRRGVARERSLLLPLPSSPRRLPPRDDARRELGLAPGAPVVLTIASPYKLRPVLSPSYSDIVDAVLDADPAATLLLVGPTPADAVVREHERVRAVGRVADIGPYLAAADVLVDSWPITGGTTTLDAGSARLPVVALGDPSLEMNGAPVGELGDSIVRPRTVEELGAAVAALLADPGERARLGAVALEAVTERHDRGWGAAMEAIVQAARAHAGHAAVPNERDGERIADWEAVIHLVREGHDQPCTARDAYLWNAPELPHHLIPRRLDEVDARLAALHASKPAPPRAVAAPDLDSASIERLLARMRELSSEGAVESCLIVVPPDRLDEAVALIEPALGDSDDLDVELAVGDGVEGHAGERDLVLA